MTYSILWLVVNASLFTIIPSLISHFEHGHFTLAQAILSLNERLSTPNIKLPKITSSSSQLDQYSTVKRAYSVTKEWWPVRKT